MSNSKALVTLAIGAKYLHAWRAFCQNNWRRYADLHGYDLIAINHPFDDSERAKRRSPAWQKCLVLSQDFARGYERIVWLDADILINIAAAPSIVEGIPPDKVGAVEEFSTPTRQLFLQAYERACEYWRSRGVNASFARTPADSYARFGLPQKDDVAQSGVLVVSPRHHRPLLERVYYNYEDRGGAEWGEMYPLSYELLKSDSVHWIDPLFNQGWLHYKLMHYPFLVKAGSSDTIRHRLKRKLLSSLQYRCEERLERACATAAFLNSYFLHFAGSKEDMRLVDVDATSWRDCRL